jgi:hypothetical protein
MENSEFSPLTIRITNALSKDDKKNNGIFITPGTIITKFIENIRKYNNNNYKNILEPSCGTCEIINHLDNNYKNVNITGIELNKIIYDEIIKIFYDNNNNIKLINGDFLKYDNKEYFDLVIGNPPYVVCSKKSINKNYEDYIIGRPNLFGLFILHSLSLLKENGILAFIIPSSFLNSNYYSKIRNYIKETCEILDIIDFGDDDKFMETKQVTIGLIIRKNIIKNNTECKYSLLLNDSYIFTLNLSKLKDIFKDSTTLEKMNMFVKTGNIVWNQKKDILTEDKKKTLLVYNSNIINNKLELKNFKNDEKKQYIDMKGNKKPFLVVNRGNGNSSYNLNFCLISGDKEYLVENHLNIIYSKDETLNDVELIKKYEIIINSFENKKTKKFIKIFLGNNGLSKTELETIFPIYL